MSNGHFENPPEQFPRGAPPQEREGSEESFESASNIEFSVGTIASEEHPERNEDAVLSMPDEKVFGVFDGMGGREGGQEASKIAEETVRKILEQREIKGSSPKEIEEMLREALHQAHLEIRKSQERNQELSEMGTTASIVKFWEDEKGQRRITIANVGDSRVYRYSLPESLEKITLDHDVASASIKDKETLREIQAALDNIKNPNEITAIAGVPASEIEKFWKLRNQVTGMLGGSAKPRIYSLVIEQGERIIITSDGIHGNLTHQEMVEVLHKANTKEEMVAGLIQRAREISRMNTRENPRAKKDDMSVVVCETSPTLPEKKVSFPEKLRAPESGEEIVAAISRAESLGDLLDVIGGIEDLQGTNKFYNGEELIRVILDIGGRVRDGLGEEGFKKELRRIPRTSGLRDKVEELLKSQLQ